MNENVFIFYVFKIKEGHSQKIFQYKNDILILRRN